MASVKIEKFVDGEHEKSLHVPVFVLAIARRLLFGSALESLARGGVDLQEILEAKQKGASYAKTVYVREHGVSKKIVISLT